MTQGHWTIFLNGTSSSGKSSIARALQARLAEPHLHVEVDAFMDMLPETIRENRTQLQDLIPRLVSSFHRAVAAMADGGLGLIVDHVLGPQSLRDATVALKEHAVVFVGVRCSLSELQRRETQRGDRQPGLAKSQFGVVHAHETYDVQVDTVELSAEKCAEKIIRFLRAGKPATAFQRILASASAE